MFYELDGVVDYNIVLLLCFQLYLIYRAVDSLSFVALVHLPGLVFGGSIGDIFVPAVEGFCFFIFFWFQVLLHCILHLKGLLLFLDFCIFLGIGYDFLFEMPHLYFLKGELIVVKDFLFVFDNFFLFLEYFFLPLVQIFHSGLGPEVRQ